jgi:hypothetical protein
MNTQSSIKKSTKASKEQVIRIFYFWLLIAIITLGVEGAIRKGSLTDVIQLFPQLGILSLPEVPTSLIIFGVFGFILYKKFRSYSILMLGATYCSWELFSSNTLANGIHNMILYGYSGIPNPIIMSIWGLFILFTFYIVHPKVNFTNWACVIVFLYSVEQPLINIEYHVNAAHVVGQLIWCFFIYQSFRLQLTRPKSDRLKKLNWFVDDFVNA